MTLKFCPLASGSSGNAIYVECGSVRLLVDAGVPMRRIAAELSAIGVNPASLSGVLVTHEHSDHISGVGVISRKYDLPVYAAGNTWQAMAGKLGEIASRNVRAFEPGQDFYIGDVNVMPFRIPHDAVDPVGFSFSADRGKLSIATDIGYASKGWMREVEFSDVLLIESNHDVSMLEASRYPAALKRRIRGRRGHLSNDEAAAIIVKLCERGVRSFILGHLSGENNDPGLAYESAIAALRKAGITPGAGVNITVAPRSCRGAVLSMESGC
jgi:phosphoribosyl 1,2-cyclic phosphodiesterase